MPFDLYAEHHQNNGLLILDMKRINNTYHRLISICSVISAVSVLTACGEGSKNPSTNTISAQQATIRIPLNDTGVTYFIDNQVQSVTYTTTKPDALNNTVLDLQVVNRPVIFPATGTESNFSSPWEINGSAGSNNEPIGNGTPLYKAQQDAATGNDPLNILNDADGKAGFQFVKLDRTTGSELPASATEYGCVKDKVTGLTWEHKTSANSQFQLHRASDVYSWYNPDPNTNGGDEGQINGGACSGSFMAGDTLNFITQVNNNQLCGKSNWRLPTIEELRSLVDYEKPGYIEPLIDQNFFPNLAVKEHRWSSQTNPQNIQQAYGFHFYEGKTQPHNKACSPASQGSFLNGIVLVHNPD